MKLQSGIRTGLKVLVLAVLMPLTITACTSTGNSFNTQARNQLVVGVTTMEQAVQILGADPVNTYRQLDGSATSIWARKNSMLTDAIYLNQELWLAFGPDGRFVRVVKTHNLPTSAPATKPAVQPAQPPVATTATAAPVTAPDHTLVPSTAVTSPTPATPPVVVSPAYAAEKHNDIQLNVPAVSYPIAQ